MNLLNQFGVSDWARGFKPVSCSAEPCRRWLTERQLHVRRVGVTLAGHWYCGYACASRKIEARLRDLLLPRAQRRMAASRPSLALTLVRRGLLSDAQHRNVVETQRATAEEFGDLTVRLGYVPETAVTESRAMHWSCPVFSYVPGLARPAVHIPPLLRRLHSMVPLHGVPAGNRFFVGFRYGVEYAALFALEQIVGCSTQPCLISPQDFRALHDGAFNDAAPEQRCVEGLGGAEEMAQLLCASGRSMDADSVAISRCGDVVWCRLTGGSRAEDLLILLDGSHRTLSRGGA